MEKGVGFTFPSSDLTQIKEDTTSDPPKMTIKPMSPTGELGLDFDQDMIFPETVDQELYNSVLEVSIASGLDDTVTYGRFGSQPDGRRLQEGEGDANGFLVYVTEHTSRELNMKTVFDDPSSVSSLATATVQLTVKQPQVFKSQSL